MHFTTRGLDGLSDCVFLCWGAVPLIYPTSQPPQKTYEAHWIVSCCAASEKAELGRQNVPSALHLYPRMSSGLCCSHSAGLPAPCLGVGCPWYETGGDRVSGMSRKLPGPTGHRVHWDQQGVSVHRKQLRLSGGLMLTTQPWPTRPQPTLSNLHGVRRQRNSNMLHGRSSANRTDQFQYWRNCNRA